MFPYGVAVEPPSDGVGPPFGGVAGQVTCPRSSWSVSMVLPACPYDVQSEATIIPAEFAPIVTSYICDGPQLSQPVWSQRIHCIRTGLPIVAEITAASSEACGL